MYQTDSGRPLDLVNPSEIYQVIADIKGGIEACRERKFGGSMMKLVYCGIDTMAYLSMPDGLSPQEMVSKQKSHFIDWVKDYLGYLYPGCKPEYLWEARNGLVHSHSTESKNVKSGNVPSVVYVYRSRSPVSVGVDPNDRKVKRIMLSMERLIQEFFTGMDRFILELLADDHTRLRTIERCESKLRAVDTLGRPVEHD